MRPWRRAGWVCSSVAISTKSRSTALRSALPARARARSSHQPVSHTRQPYGSGGHIGVGPRPREHIARLTPYEWEAMASEVAAAAGIAESEVVRFDTNTTPWPPVAWELTVLDAPR